MKDQLKPTTTRARFTYFSLLLVPLLASYIGQYAHTASELTFPADWLTVVNYGVVAVNIYLIGICFFFARLFTRNSERLRARGWEPNGFILQIATACSVTPAWVALFAGVGGASQMAIYAWSVVSMTAALLWGWRYKYVLQKHDHQAA